MISPHEATRLALAAVYSGAGDIEAEAFLQHLADEGYRVTRDRAAQRQGEAA